MLQAQLTAATAHGQAATGEVAKLQQRNQVFQAESATLRAKLKEGGEGARQAMPSRPQTSAPDRRSLQELLRDPSGRKELEAGQLSALRHTFSALPAALELSPPEASQLQELLLRRRMAGLEEARNFADPVDTKSPRWQAVSAEIQQMLGGEKYARFQEFERTAEERSRLQYVEQAMNLVGRPLSQGQMQALASLQLDETSRMRQSSPSLPQGRPPTTSELHAFLNNWEAGVRRTLEGAKTILSPEQFAVYQEEQMRQLQMGRQQLSAVKAPGQ